VTSQVDNVIAEYMLLVHSPVFCRHRPDELDTKK
jgi:hypothetical protein